MSHPNPATTGAELIVTAQQQLVSTERAVNQLVAMLKRANQPAELREVQFNQQSPKAVDQSGREALSIGFYNPTKTGLYTTINGGLPEPGRDSLVIPALTLVVLPLPAGDIGLGVDPADVANVPAAPAAITAYILRFATVQPASGVRLG